MKSLASKKYIESRAQEAQMLPKFFMQLFVHFAPSNMGSPSLYAIGVAPQQGKPFALNTCLHDAHAFRAWSQTILSGQ